MRCSIVQREHEHSRSLEQSLPPVQQLSSIPNATNDKQSRSFDAVHLLRPGSLRPESAANRRTKSYENADDHRPARLSIAPPPIIIRIPDMAELVQAAQLSRLQSRRESADMVKSVCPSFTSSDSSFRKNIRGTPAENRRWSNRSVSMIIMKRRSLRRISGVYVNRTSWKKKNIRTSESLPMTSRWIY